MEFERPFSHAVRQKEGYHHGICIDTDSASHEINTDNRQQIFDPTEDYREAGLKRDFKPRHLVFISLGACIGTGIFLGVGQSLKDGGPLGLLLGYSLVGSVVVCVMLMITELTTFLPVNGAHIILCGRFVDPALSAIMGWNNTAAWTLTLAAELSAAAVLVTYWIPASQVNGATWISIGSIAILSVNSSGTRWYGELEFGFVSIKVFTLIAVIIISIVILSGGGPHGVPMGFKFWNDPGPLVQYEGIPGAKGRFLGFFEVVYQASFSMMGAEILALAAAECRNPRKVLPICIRTVWVRIIFFYCVSVFLIGLIVPSDNELLGSARTAVASPFVIAIEAAGIKILPSIINAAILTSALSAGCSDLYTSSRSLHSLAQKGQAPRMFKRTLKNGIPHLAVGVTWLIANVAYLGSSSSSAVVFAFLVKLTALSNLLTWLSISITYIRFRDGMKAQSIPRSILPWRSRLTLAGAYWTMLMAIIILFLSGWKVFRPGKWDTLGFFSNYLPIAWFILGYLFFKLYWKTFIILAHEMDFVSGVKDIEGDSRRWDEEDTAKVVPGLRGKLKGWFA